MRKKKVLSTIVAALLVGSVLAPTAAFADAPTTTSSVIDDTKKGSIKLVKYADPDANWVEAHGLDSDALPDALPIMGIEFTQYKVADISTYMSTDAEGNGEIGTYYTNLTSAFTDLLTAKEITLTPDRVDGDKKYYTAATLQTALTNVNKKGQADVEQIVLDNGTKFDATDANGATSQTDLALGLYLIAETDTQNAKVANNWLTGDDTYAHMAGLESQNTDMTKVLPYGNDGDVFADGVDATSCTIYSKTCPYLISIPTTNTAEIEDGNAKYPAGTVWMYDVVSYPKNSITDVTKMIVDQDDEKTLRTYEDYEIGDTIHQVLITGIQGLREEKKHEFYKISDTMTKSLDFSKLVSVKYGKRTKAPETTDDFADFTAFDAADYTLTVTDDNHAFSVDFTEVGLAKLDEVIDGDYIIVVSFDAILNKDAEIGPKAYDDVNDNGEYDDGDVAHQNMNRPTLEFGNTGESRYKVSGNKVYVFTYKIDVTKDGLDDLKQATFTVQRATKKIDADATKTNNEDGDLIPDGTDLKLIKEEDGVYHLFDNSRDKEADIVTRINPDENGKLYVKGVDSEQYVIVEVATEPGKNLLTHAFELVITAPDKGDASLAAPNNGSHRDGTVTAEAVTADSAGSITKRIPLMTEDGIVFITIHNNDVVSLHTGGSGTYWFYIASALMLLGVGAGVIIYKKKKTVNE